MIIIYCDYLWLKVPVPKFWRCAQRTRIQNPSVVLFGYSKSGSPCVCGLCCPFLFFVFFSNPIPETPLGLRFAWNKNSKKTNAIFQLSMHELWDPEINEFSRLGSHFCRTQRSDRSPTQFWNNYCNFLLLHCCSFETRRRHICGVVETIPITGSGEISSKKRLRPFFSNQYVINFFF